MARQPRERVGGGEAKEGRLGGENRWSEEEVRPLREPLEDATPAKGGDDNATGNGDATTTAVTTTSGGGNDGFCCLCLSVCLGVLAC